MGSPALKLKSASRKLEMHEICSVLETQGHIDAETSKKLIKSSKIGRLHPFTVINRHELRSRKDNETNLNMEWLTGWLAEYSGRPYKEVDPLKLDLEKITKLLPKAFIKRIGVLPIEVTETKVVFATAEPFDTSWYLDTSAAIKRDIEVVITEPDKIASFIEEFYEVRSAINQVGSDVDMSGHAESLGKLNFNDINTANPDEGNVAKIVDWIFQFAQAERATDIHLEPRGESAQMRFRIDGSLRIVYKFELNVFLPVLSRIKIIADMKVDEKRRPQDGRIKRKMDDGRIIEMRLSTIPTQYGEKLVLRIFDPQATNKTFQDLGFNPQDIQLWNELISNPYGLILVTGPTGSGKTTTLQASLTSIHSPEINICTIEDPVEIINENFAQMQVNPDIDLSFGEAIRSFLRQDPDVIMVGEIRDKDAAEMAIQASLTGHLVLSTLHTNSALASVTRLMDIGVQPHLINASLLGMLAQRLVKVLCPKCKEKIPTPPEMWKAVVGPYRVNPPPHVYKAVGCRECKNSGYHGRICVYELVKVIPELKDKLAVGLKLSDIEALYRGKYIPLRINGAQKVAQGITSLEEVLKVII